jgi:uncharacterized protein (DUF433 family)
MLRLGFKTLHYICETMKDRITIDSEICHGKPCIRGMRWPVEVILDMLGSGMSTDEIIEDHPELEKEDILACLNFAKLYVSGNNLQDVA